MTSSVNFPHTLPENPEPGSPGSERLCQEFVLVQNREGRYLSFCWNAPPGSIALPSAESILHQNDRFAPTQADAYLNRVQQVLRTLTPDRCRYTFQSDSLAAPFDLVISPVFVPQGAPTTVVVTGRLVAEEERLSPLNGSAYPPEQAMVSPVLAAFPSSDRYQKLLTVISWSIRRTLDLPTIWKQTVQGLGKALGVERCVVCAYQSLALKAKVAAEYCSDEFTASLLETEFSIMEDAYLHQAISSLRPIAVQRAQIGRRGDHLLHYVLEDGGESVLSETVPLSEVAPAALLIVPTCYQDQPNGVILLYQTDRPNGWNQSELEFMRDLADQVGTAIAHATLFNASQSLAEELQRVNSSLMQKHRELEEARQQAEEASRLKSEFLANTSHELRTPLNGMIGFLKLVMDGMADDPEEQSEFINEAYRSALHLLNIINDVLDIAKIEAGKLQIEMSPVKLDELLSDVEDFTRSQIHQKQLSFEIQTPPTVDEIVLFGNYQRLLQVMLNLVGNAIKFTHEGGITISAELIKKKIAIQNQDCPGLVKVRVEDTGIGVSLDKQDKLFQSFSQVDGSRTRQYGGTGLGLAISQKLVEAMGGEVNFYSLGEGLGSTVTFTVPLFQEPIVVTSAAGETGSSLKLSRSA